MSCRVDTDHDVFVEGALEVASEAVEHTVHCNSERFGVEPKNQSIKHLIIGETYKYDLCLKCHHTLETLCTHEFCIWLIRVGIRQGFNLFRFEIDRM